MAHGKTVSGKKSFRFKGGWSTHKIELAKAFLKAIEAQAPEVVEEWRALFPLAKAAIETQAGYYYDDRGILKERRNITGPDADAKREAYRVALAAWASKFHLDAYWLLQVVHNKMANIVSVGGPVTWPHGFSTDIVWSPIIKSFTFEVPASEPGDLIKDYRKRAIDAFKEALEKRINSAVDSFERDPKIAQEPFMEKGSHAAICDAASWQTRGELLEAEAKTVKAILDRLTLKPRPGLLK